MEVGEEARGKGRRRQAGGRRGREQEPKIFTIWNFAENVLGPLL